MYQNTTLLNNITSHSVSGGNLPFYDEDNAGRKLETLREVLRWIIVTAVALILAFFLVFAFGLKIQVTGNGMKDQVEDGQQVLVNRLSFRLSSPSRRAVVAWYPGGDSELAPLIGRIVAIPGETVQITNGILLINGVPDTYSGDGGQIPYAGIAERTVTLGDNEYFILEDDRSNTEDSRDPYIGPVEENQIIGRVWLCLWGDGASLHRVR